MVRINQTQSLTRNLLLTSLVIGGLLTLNTYAKQPIEQSTSLTGVQSEQLSQARPCPNVAPGELTAKTELYFGLSKANGSQITDQEFQSFLNREITPRFPDGLTLLEGQGQFKNANGKIIRERSRVLILIHPFGEMNNEQIEQIRAGYKKAFQQEAVLRFDEEGCAAF